MRLEAIMPLHKWMKNAFSVGLMCWTPWPPLHSQSRLSVLTGFDQPPDTAAVEWMERETAALFSEAGLTFSWQQRTHLESGAAERFVWLQFHGKCRLDPSDLSAATDGPLGSARVLDGEVQPFIEVDCDRAAAMVWQDRGTVPRPLVMRSLGRALGRVVAHELYHYLTQSTGHTSSELFRQAVTSKDLTLPIVRFETNEIQVLREGLKERAGSAGQSAARE
ncbi:MAG TPA: hypothetical protein VKU19_13440 [Bryobacteraceae bacterium]|nr:hypothetical protein [Bryobacteraceae bacterium]